MHTSDKKPTITIIGAGIAGCFFAILLSKRGYNVEIYERFSEDEVCNNASKKSYNVVFYGYGISILKKVGLWEIIEPILVKIVGSVTQVSQNPPSSRFNQTDIPYFAMQRSQLLQIFINEAKKSQRVTFHFDTTLIAVSRKKRKMFIQNTKSNKYRTVTCNVIIGADGVHSQVRTFLQQGQETSHRQEYLPWEYKQIYLKKEFVEKLNLQTNLTYAWTRKSCVLFSYMNKDQSLSALLVLPKETKKSFASLTSEAKIETFFKENFSDFLPILPQITKAMLHNPTSQFVTIYTEPWYYKDLMVLIGDAAHCFLPFSGQGMSAAFADCMELVELMDKYGSDWATIFPLYQANRKKHTDALANLSKKSFVQYLRYKKADYSAIYNKFDVLLYNFFPTIFNPPPYIPIATDPTHAADHQDKHEQQRKTAKFLGIPLLVHLATGIIAIQEKFSQLYARRKS